MAKLKKPKKEKALDLWDYHKVEHYLEELHKKSFRDYAGKYSNKSVEICDEIPYQDWWQWVCRLNEVLNGGYLWLPDWSYAEDEHTEPWKKEIMQFFKDFLGEDYHERMWVAW